MAATLTLNCFLLSKTTSFQDAFQVKIDDDDSVDSLKDAIKQRNMNKMEDIDATDLMLFKVEKTQEQCLALDTQLLEDATRMQALKTVGYYFSKPKSEFIRVLVRIPDERPRKRRHMNPSSFKVDGDVLEDGLQANRLWTGDTTHWSDLRRRWLTPPSPLPALEELQEYLLAPLGENEKIPLSEVLLVNLISSDPDDTCGREVLLSLFRVSETEVVPDPFNIQVIYAIKTGLSSLRTGDLSYISLWDTHIGNILQLITKGEVIRASNKNTGTSLRRPDFGLLLDAACPFRGEEKPPKFIGSHPRDELHEKLAAWEYDSLPYILSYYAIGPLVTFTAITSSRTVVDLYSMDLSFRRDRVNGLVCVIKLIGLIMAVSANIGHRDVPEFSDIKRDNGVIIALGAQVVRKTYPKAVAELRIRHLQKVYELLTDKAVPHVDRLDQVQVNESWVQLAPKGVPRGPKTKEEVLAAVLCVLEAMEKMHGDLYPIYHRDVRWPNIVKRAGVTDTTWFLIDWDNAAIAPTTAATEQELSRTSHPPA
ncbi:hypothetical protein FRC17_005574, partial [Serendipita sp. 399]